MAEAVRTRRAHGMYRPLFRPRPTQSMRGTTYSDGYRSGLRWGMFWWGPLLYVSLGALVTCAVVGITDFIRMIVRLVHGGV